MITISKKRIEYFLVLTPFLFVYVGIVFQNTSYGSLTPICKTLSFLYMLMYVIIKNKFSNNLTITTFIFLPFFIFAVYKSYSFEAALSDGLRYFFPIIILFYSYSIRYYFPLLLSFIIAFVIINFLVQIVNYINWLRGIDQWFYYKNSKDLVYYNQAAGIIRATGTVVFFGFYGFFNMISFFIIKQYYIGKYKLLLLLICLSSLFLSLSYKTLITFFLLITILNIKYFLKIVPVLLISLITFISFVPNLTKKITGDLKNRYEFYISEGNSVRSESYRVMSSEISNLNLFGRGIGTFGGPASVKYDSPFYQEVYFYWYDTKWLELPTTDTYPPHVFVEIGIIGGLLYFLILIIPLFYKTKSKKYTIILIIYFSLFSDMLFSFSLNSLEFLLYSLVFVYPLIYYKKNDYA